jgi:hypothetical protein
MAYSHHLSDFRHLKLKYILFIYLRFLLYSTPFLFVPTIYLIFLGFFDKKTRDTIIYQLISVIFIGDILVNFVVMNGQLVHGYYNFPTVLMYALALVGFPKIFQKQIVSIITLVTFCLIFMGIFFIDIILQYFEMLKAEYERLDYIPFKKIFSWTLSFLILSPFLVKVLPHEIPCYVRISMVFHLILSAGIWMVLIWPEKNVREVGYFIRAHSTPKTKAIVPSPAFGFYANDDENPTRCIYQWQVDDAKFNDLAKGDLFFIYNKQFGQIKFVVKAQKMGCKNFTQWENLKVYRCSKVS